MKTAIRLGRLFPQHLNQIHRSLFDGSPLAFDCITIDGSWFARGIISGQTIDAALNTVQPVYQADGDYLSRKREMDCGLCAYPFRMDYQ